MFFLYCDASGNHKIRKNHNNPPYVLSGILLHEKQWKEIENNLSSLKIGIFPEKDPSEWEFHASEGWHGYGIFENVEKNKIIEAFDDFSKIIVNSKITIISSLLHKNLLENSKLNDKILREAWTYLIERFEFILKDMPDYTNNGLVFPDSDLKGIQDEIKGIIAKLVRRGSRWQKINHVIEYPVFTESHYRNLIQLSDFVAYVIHRWNVDQEDPYFKKWFTEISKKFFAPYGSYENYGLKEYPKIER